MSAPGFVAGALDAASSGLGGGPVAPDGPLAWTTLAWARRESLAGMGSRGTDAQGSAPSATSVAATTSDESATPAEVEPLTATTEPLTATEVDSLTADVATDPLSAAMAAAPTAVAPATMRALAATPTDPATAATTTALLAGAMTEVPTAAAAAAAVTTTPYLPFDMQTLPTDKEVFAHYVPWLPISPDNLPADQDYYTTQYLNPLGENGAHAAYGGYMRDRPLPRDPINDPNWKYLDIKTEVNQAKSIGIDGFAVDIVLPSFQNTEINNLLTAAQSTPGFSIQPTADMSGPLGDFTPTQFSDEFAPYLTSPGAYRLSDGRVVLGAFYAERQTASWWGDTFTALHDDHDVDVAFVPTFLDAYNNMASFAPISYGFGNWGGRNTASTDPTNSSPGTQVNLVRTAHALGKIWMQPVAFQDNRPREGLYEESQNSVSSSNSWQIANDEGAEWVQLVTWNDYAEGTAMAPSVDHGYRMMDMQAYNLAELKYGTDPTVVRDAMYVSNRTQFADAASTYEETLPMQIRPGSPAAVNNVEVVVYATAPSTILATIGGVTSSCQVGAGRSSCTFPLQIGDVSVSMVRNGVVQQTVNSPYSVTAAPYVQDLEYHVAGGLR